MREVNPISEEITPTAAATPAAPLDQPTRNEITALARRQSRANGPLMQAITYLGGQVEDGLALLPEAARDRINDIARKALRQSYDLAAGSRGGLGARIGSDRLDKTVGTLSGALGGAGGLPSALIEIPITTTLIFRAVHRVAVSYGEPPDAPETRMQCLAVFGKGGPGEADDGIDTAFLGARLSITGAAVNGLISQVAPRLAAVLSQKLASQAVPVLGAAAGAGTNYAFVDYYVEMAHVHFGLRALARDHDAEAVADCFHAALAAPKDAQT